MLFTCSVSLHILCAYLDKLALLLLRLILASFRVKHWRKHRQLFVHIIQNQLLF